MTGRIVFITLLAFLLSLVYPAGSEMTSNSYRIRSSVQSAGGVPTGSVYYQLNSTVSQPSPIMNPHYPPLSDTYDLYPGFWYSVAAIERTCPGDFDGDRDVDGSDLADYIFDPAGLGVDVFAAYFGVDNCL
jgi:hypothetical protein